MIIIASYSNVSVTYTADGTQTTFSFPFDYLRKAFVFVEVNGETVLEQGTDYNVVDKTVVFITAPVADTVVKIYRQTDTTPLVSWADASVLRAKDMTIQQIQELHILEEQKQWVKDNTLFLNNGVLDAKEYRIANVGEPEDPEDAATKYYVDHQYDNSNVMMKTEDGEHWTAQGIPFKDWLGVGDVPGDHLVLSSVAGNGAFVEAYNEDSQMGARLVLRHNDNSTNPGQFELDARKTADGVTTEAKLVGTPDGSLKWNREEVLKGNEVFYYFNPQSEYYLDSGATNNIVGECNVIKVGDKVIMIDTGGANRSTSIKGYLQGIGITKVDYLIISHWHYDHFSNLENMNYIDWSDCVAYVPILPEHDDIGDYNWIMSNAPSAITYITANFKSMITPQEYQVLQIADNFKLTFYNCGHSAHERVYTRQTAEMSAHPGFYERYLNDYSTVVKVDHNNVSLVYSGDIMKVAQDILYDQKAFQNIDVYKMHHHGVNGQMSGNYCRSLKPKILTCQVAQNNNNSYLTNGVFSSDLQCFLDSRILIPYMNRAVLKTDGHKVTIVEGNEVYTQQDKAVLNLSANTNRVVLPADFNDFKQGTYTIMSGANVSAMSNAPSNYTGGNAKLICMKSAGEAGGLNAYITQFLIPTNTTERIYVRNYINSDTNPHWSDWLIIPFITSTGIRHKGDTISGETDDYWMRFNGGSAYGNGSSIILYGKDITGSPGFFTITASDGTNTRSLIGRPNGTLTFDGKSVLYGNTYEEEFTVSSIGANVSANVGTLAHAPKYWSVIYVSGSGWADTHIVINSGGTIWMRNNGSAKTNIKFKVWYVAA